MSMNHSEEAQATELCSGHAPRRRDLIHRRNLMIILSRPHETAHLPNPNIVTLRFESPFMICNLEI